MDAAGQSDTWNGLHERFREDLYALSNLPRLSQMIDGLLGQMRSYAKLYSDDPEQLRRVQAERYALLKALRNATRRASGQSGTPRTQEVGRSQGNGVGFRRLLEVFELGDRMCELATLNMDGHSHSR